MTALELTTLALLISAIARLLTFQRHGKRHRQGAAALAWLMTTALATLAINIATQRVDIHNLGWTLVIVLSALNIALFAVRGNVAQLLKWIKNADHAATR